MYNSGSENSLKGAQYGVIREWLILRIEIYQCMSSRSLLNLVVLVVAILYERLALKPLVYFLEPDCMGSRINEALCGERRYPFG